MSCGNKPLVKKWDKPRNMRFVKPSRYEQNEASVKLHWRKVVRDLELSYKDEQFWETQGESVRGLVGPTIYYRIAKIFNLPFESTQYEPQSDLGSSAQRSELFYKSRSGPMATRQEFSLSDFSPSQEEEEEVEEESEQWSLSSLASDIQKSKTSKIKSVKSMTRTKSVSLSRPASRLMSKSFSKFLSKTLQKSFSSKSKSAVSVIESDEESASSSDDLKVNRSYKPKK